MPGVHGVAGVGATADPEAGSFEKDVPVPVDVVTEAVRSDRGGRRRRQGDAHRIRLQVWSRRFLLRNLSV